MSEHNQQTEEAVGGHSVDARLARPGAITYLHIPADNVNRAAAFYRDVFGWKINGIDTVRPSFDDLSGQVSGAWMEDLQPSRRPGLLPYIYVDDVKETVRQIVAHGGQIELDPYLEGKLTVATFRDPSGNIMGLWHDGTR